MPANLNALIRYKTINSCLYGGKRRWSIVELREKCSAALAEYRGRYDTISERTIRDDIRVMRSDILGYNAPIAQQKGMYYYSDPNYSIMTLTLTDSALIERIIMFLGEIRTEVSHPELEIILDNLIDLKNKYFTGEFITDKTPLPSMSDPSVICEMSEDIIKQGRRTVKAKTGTKGIRFSEEASLPMSSAPSFRGFDDQLTWGTVMDALFKLSVQ
jgi:hypothetical protein